MSKSYLSTSIQGIRGGEYKHIKNNAAVKISIDYDGVNESAVYVDAFTGQGKDFKRREKSLINIYNEKGVPVFFGSMEDLIKKLV